MSSPPAADWMATGGAYWLIGGGWLFIAISYYIIADRIGRVTNAEHDGCLHGIMNVLLTVFGGGVGLAMATYPTFVVTSLLGALLFPTIGTIIIVRKKAHHHRGP